MWCIYIYEMCLLCFSYRYQYARPDVARYLLYADTQHSSKHRFCKHQFPVAVSNWLLSFVL